MLIWLQVPVDYRNGQMFPQILSKVNCLTLKMNVKTTRFLKSRRLLNSKRQEEPFTTNQLKTQTSECQVKLVRKSKVSAINWISTRHSRLNTSSWLREIVWCALHGSMVSLVLTMLIASKRRSFMLMQETKTSASKKTARTSMTDVNKLLLLVSAAPSNMSTVHQNTSVQSPFTTLVSKIQLLISMRTGKPSMLSLARLIPHARRLLSLAFSSLLLTWTARSKKAAWTRLRSSAPPSSTTKIRV